MKIHACPSWVVPDLFFPEKGQTKEVTSVFSFFVILYSSLKQIKIARGMGHRIKGNHLIHC